MRDKTFSNDTILRLEAVKDEIGTHHDEGWAWCAEVIDDAINLLKEQQQYLPDWKTEPPTESGYYLITIHEWSDGEFLPKFDNTYVKRMHYQDSERFTGWNYPRYTDKEAEKDIHREVLAWNYIPKKYIPQKENYLDNNNCR